MATLKYWDGSQWQPIQLPNIYAANGYQTARASASTGTLPVSPNTAVTGASLTMPVVSSAERFLVLATFDFNATAATSSTGIGRLYVDGAEYNVNMQCLYNASVNLGRACVFQHWIVTGLTPGNHTFALYASATVAGVMNLLSPHTGITVVSLGPPPSPPGATLPKPLMCQITAIADQSVANSSVTYVIMGQTNYDTAPGLGFAAMADLANNRIIIPQSGYYRIYGRLNWAANATGGRAGLIRLNGGGYMCDVYGAPNPSATATIQQFNSDPWPFNAGDYVSLIGVQYSGAPLNLTISNGRYSILTAEYVCSL